MDLTERFGRVTRSCSGEYSLDQAESNGWILTCHTVEQRDEQQLRYLSSRSYVRVGSFSKSFPRYLVLRLNSLLYSLDESRYGRGDRVHFEWCAANIQQDEMVESSCVYIPFVEDDST